MKYLAWIWHNTSGIRTTMLIRIVAGIGRVSLGLLMVWLCKRFIDVTIRTGTREDILWMIALAAVLAIGFFGMDRLGKYMDKNRADRQDLSRMKHL